MKNNRETDCLTSAALQALLPSCEEVTVRVLEEIDSTNSEAKRMFLEGNAGTWLIAAKRQSSGRGRLGRSFYSPEGSGVYFSILVPVVGELPNAVSLTCAAAVAVMRAVRKLTGKQTAIKWVNDLFYAERKVCGILCEAVTVGAVQSLIIGIGINLKSAEFPKELQSIAGTLGADDLSRAELIAAIYRELSQFLKDPSNRSWLDDYRACSMVLGHRVCWMSNEDRFEGIAESIDENGALAVRTDLGELIHLRTGEITLRLS